MKDVLATTLETGKWFATARRLGLLDLAVELAKRSPTAPKTLNRGGLGNT